MKKLVIATLLVLLAVALIFNGCAKTTTPTPAPSSVTTSASTTTPASKTITLRFATTAPPMDYNCTQAQGLADRFNARAQGKYQMVIFPAESLVKMPEELDAVRTGAAEMADMAPGMESALDARFGAMDLPFIFDSFDAKLAVLKPMSELWDPIFQEKFNQKIVALPAQPTYNPISKKPLKTLEDWKGRLVLPLGPSTGDVIVALGGASVWVNWPEAYDSLQKGVIDVIISAFPSAVSFHFIDVAHYATYVGLINSAALYTINLDVWKAMPKDIQDIMLEEASTMESQFAEHHKSAELSNIKALQDAGGDVYVLPKEERDRWRAATSSVIDKYIAQMQPDSDKIRAIIDKANKENP
jgi:TRAP-type C4-dicarboxylate transport system substrate-binding protein